MNQIKIFDTTLRDGEQSPGCSMNLKEKIEVAKCLERLKVDEETLAKRKAAWVCPEPKVKTGYLARYAKLVSSADKGAILE